MKDHVMLRSLSRSLSLRCAPGLALAFAFGGACAVLADAQTQRSAPTSAERPNLVLVVSDDHGFGDIGWHDESLRTPHLERLAREGVRLDRFYVNPVCSVTRAALLTGLATRRTGVNNSSGLALGYRILPQHLQASGYQTWMFGKWHLGGAEGNARQGEEYLPHRRGFDHFYGFLHGAIDYETHQRKDLSKVDWQRNGETVEEEGFTTDLLVAEAIQKLEQRDRSKPFFAYLAFNAVHGPLVAPPGAGALGREKRAVLRANLEHLDRALGRFLAALEQQGQRERTLLLFCGDNGGQLNQGSSNGGLRGEKGTLFEGGIRVPALIHWPEKIAPRSPSEQFVCAMDVLPTLASAAGISLGEGALDGLDLWSALQKGEVLERAPFVMGTREACAFAPPWKLVPNGEGGMALYDVVADPEESQDRAATEPERVAALQAVIDAIPAAEGGGRGGRAKDEAGGGGKKRRGESGASGGTGETPPEVPPDGSEPPARKPKKGKKKEQL